MTKPLYLTKSLFKTGFECPAKLRYAKDPSYGNNKDDNEFLKNLAEGGFQVGEMAKLMFPNGVEITERDHLKAVAQTYELITKPSATVFEAAMTHGDCFVRIDILRKSGNDIDIIEVKSKSYDPSDPNLFKTNNGKFTGSGFAYLLDVAFQTMVVQRALPTSQIRSFLMMPNKAHAATVDGLNQFFPLVKLNGTKKTVQCHPIADLTIDQLGEPILALIDVTDYVQEILRLVFDIPGITGTVSSLTDQLLNVLHNPFSHQAPVQSQCKSCEFRMPLGDALKSGFHTCWREVVDHERLNANEPLVVDLWDGRRTSTWMSQNKYFMRDLTPEDLGLQQDSKKLSRTQRQWMQISGEGLNEQGYYFDADLVAREMATWHWPINLIDFETSRTALPFHRGGKPYGLVAFQWSHHVLHEDGKLEHVNDFLKAEPGALPNVDFLKALQETLSHHDGTVMMWSPYENAVLNSLLTTLAVDLMLSDKAKSDEQHLRSFIESLTITKQGDKILHRGNRAMVDLCQLSSDSFFHTRAGGSNSIKKVLPAMLTASDFLKTHYSQPIYGGVNANSRNFIEPMTWWQLDVDGKVIDPYLLLPSVFADLESHDMDDDTMINQGGAAAVAYGRLQLEHVGFAERDAWRQALLKYCELDTLAMAMIVQGWRSWLK